MIADKDPNAEWVEVPLLTSPLFLTENKSLGNIPECSKVKVFPGEEFMQEQNIYMHRVLTVKWFNILFQSMSNNETNILNECRIY